MAGALAGLSSPSITEIKMNGAVLPLPLYTCMACIGRTLSYLIYKLNADITETSRFHKVNGQANVICSTNHTEY